MMRVSCRASMLAFGFLFSTGCGGSPRPRDVVVYASGADLESANPLTTIHSLSLQVQRYALFTTLARYDSSLNPVPYVARSWEWSDDHRELTLHLISRLKWHDGRPTTARDVSFTLLAARDPATGYARGGDLAGVDTVLALDDTTAVLRFGVAQPRFPLILCDLPILPAHLLASVPRGAIRRAPFNLAPVGNGRFRFVKRVAGQRWVFARNMEFPAELGGPPRIKSFVVAVVDEATTKLAGLASGDLDFAGIAPSMASLATHDPTINVVTYPILFSTALVFNVHRAPFNDVRVRRAIDISLDRTRMVNAVLAGYGYPAAGPVAPASPYALKEDPVRNTPVADSLLDVAGWTRGEGGWRMRGDTALAIELMSVGTGENGVEQLVQADLAARGIKVELRNTEMATLLSMARANPKRFDVMLTGVPGDLSLAYLSAMYDSRQRGGALDYSNFHTPTLDSLFANTRAAVDPEALTRAWSDVQRELAREVPAVWVYHSRGVQGVAKRMQNVRMDLRGELTSLGEWSVVGAPNDSSSATKTASTGKKR
jgi:peptide/nickel transport system substrate-binding protein